MVILVCHQRNKVVMIMPSNIDGSDNFDTSAGGIVLQTRYAVYDQLRKLTATVNTPLRLEMLSVNIVPKSVNSVFKIELCCPHEGYSNNGNYMFSLYRNGVYIQNRETQSAQNGGITPIFTSLTNNAQSTMDTGMFVYVDAPQTTQPITYVPTIRAQDNLQIAINSTSSNLNAKHYETGISTFIVTELSGD